MPEDINFENYKTLTYHLIDFLIDKKKEIRGRGLMRPIQISLQEFSSIFEFAHGSTNEEKISELGEELLGLRDDSINGLNLLEIINSEQIFGDFVTNYNNNLLIELRYDRKILEGYRDELRKRDNEITGNVDTSERILSFNQDKNEINFGQNSIKIRGKRGNNIGINLCRLMFGLNSLPDLDGNTHQIESYSIGDGVAVESLKSILDLLKDPNGIDVYERRAIYDTVRRINEQAKIKLRTTIFLNTDPDEDVLKLNIQ